MPHIQKCQNHPIVLYDTGLCDFFLPVSFTAVQNNTFEATDSPGWLPVCTSSVKTQVQLQLEDRATYSTWPVYTQKTFTNTVTQFHLLNLK